MQNEQTRTNAQNAQNVTQNMQNTPNSAKSPASAAEARRKSLERQLQTQLAQLDRICAERLGGATSQPTREFYEESTGNLRNSQSSDPEEKKVARVRLEDLEAAGNYKKSRSSDGDRQDGNFSGYF